MPCMATVLAAFSTKITAALELSGGISPLVSFVPSDIFSFALPLTVTKPAEIHLASVMGWYLSRHLHAPANSLGKWSIEATASWALPEPWDLRANGKLYRHSPQTCFLWITPGISPPQPAVSVSCKGWEGHQSYST